MRKALVALVVVALVAAAGWWFFLRGGGGLPPAIAAHLEAQHTVGFGAVEQPAKLLAELERAVAAHKDTLPPDAQMIFDPKVRAERLGFDPTSAAGWTSVGLDPSAGLGLVVDDRRPESPIFLVRVLDEAKLLAWLTKLVGQPVAFAGKAKQGIRRLTGLREDLIVLQRGIYTAFTTQGPGKERLVAFGKGDGPSVAEDDALGPAFGEAMPGPRALFYLKTAQLKLLGGHEIIQQSVAFYAGLFPAVAMHVGQAGGGFRLVASEKGVQALQQMLVPPRAAPKFSAYVPATGWAAGRYSVNIKEYFAGLSALLPPAVPGEVKMQLGMAKMAFSMLTGVEWNTLAEAFSGHVAWAVELQSVGPFLTGAGHPNWLVLLGVSDRADAVVKTLLDKVKGLPTGGRGPKIEAIEVAGVDGHRLALAGMQAVIARVDDVLIVAPSVQAAEAAVARTKGGSTLRGTPGAAALDGEVVLGLSLDGAGLIELLRAVQPEAAAELAKLDLGEARHVSFSVAVDKHGLVSKGDGAGLAALIGALAAVAVPAFVRYQEHAKSAEAQFNLRWIADGAAAYYADEHAMADGTLLPKQLPGSVGPTPKAAPCADGPQYRPTAGDWDVKGWKDLSFSVDHPHYFQYQFIADGDGFTARAVGDLGCDGRLSTFERIGRIRPNGEVEHRAGAR